ncbi:PLP-dependent transferase [Choiromyces venosus 120613-1]|uniref:PLP-dependent transferase n=1 Tax=Choiromyces venosus 120613-1 TaxID=1336337 RepID=A0A3N4JQU4_9PEZI|nr:PLP-dependent transferase [Choiromyces venosus 120613-1]
MASPPPSKTINTIAPHFLTQLLTALSNLPNPTPDTQSLNTARAALTHNLPHDGIGLETTAQHLISLLPAFTRTTAHYYAFVTGSVTPAAYLADLLVSTVDANVQVHLPQDSLVTEVEDAALRLLCQLFRLDEEEWAGRAITTGATAGNVLGLACAREEILARRLRARGVEDGVGELGLLEACGRAGVSGVKVFSAMAHSSLLKAAAIVGIGRRNVVDIGRVDKPWEIDIARLGLELEKAGAEGVVCIIAVSIGEVNTGRFEGGMGEIRELVDEHGAWLHADAAFGIFARVLEEGEESGNGRLARGLELADSIVGDGHKILNVPYDCGFFFTRDPKVLSATFANAAPYLSSSASSDGIQSPLNIGLENSRRFRALPVYATLCAYGPNGYRDLLNRLIAHSRNIAAFIHGHESYELLNGPAEDIFMIVLFSARNDGLNDRLKKAINDTGKMYVSETMWEGRPAIRIAVANWLVESNEWEVVKEVLSELARS